MTKINGVYYDNYLEGNLSILKKEIKKDWDFWIVIDGREGSGKSTLAQQVAFYLDPDFNIDKIVFTPKQFEKAVDVSGEYSAIVWDEAVTGTQSIDMTRMARTLKKKAVQMRQKNLFIILVIHSYFDMKKYYAVHRTWFLLHVYFVPDIKNETLQRGYFEYYDFNKKKIMYLHDKSRRFYNYTQEPNFRGRFTKRYTVPETDYKDKKALIEDGEERMEERDFTEECIRRGIDTYKGVFKIKDHISYSEQHFYTIKKKLSN